LDIVNKADKDTIIGDSLTVATLFLIIGLMFLPPLSKKSGYYKN
jgi:hypothetical protein